MLQNRRRRDVLRYLREHEGPVDMRDLAEQIAAWENDTTVDALSSAERQRVYIALYQAHLPKLEEEGIIKYNQDRGIVERTPLAEQFDVYLKDHTELTQNHNSHNRWVRYYLVATVVSAAVVLAAALSIYPISLLPGLAWAAVIVLTFGLLVAANFFTH